MDETLLAVITILFVATLMRAILSFGEALIAVPLLALLMPVLLNLRFFARRDDFHAAIANVLSWCRLVWAVVKTAVSISRASTKRRAIQRPL